MRGRGLLQHDAGQLPHLVFEGVRRGGDGPPNDSLLQVISRDPPLSLAVSTHDQPPVTTVTIQYLKTVITVTTVFITPLPELFQYLNI